MSITPASTFKLTQAKIDAAASNHRYIKTDGNGELMLTGAYNYFKDHPTYVYVPRYRIVGEPERVRALLVEFGVKASDVNSALASSYTSSSSVSTQRTQFEAEVERAKEFKKNRPKENVKILNVDAVFNHIKEHNFTIVSTVTKNKDGILVQEAKADSKKRSGNHRNQTFAERFEAVESGFALDVSSLTPEGKGAKSMKAPTDASSRKMLPGLALASTTSEGMRNALKLIGRSERASEFDSILAKAATVVAK